jgi:antitoxin (DNA-binding transcriptional repressor) of toxin-antitoxin stability system
MSESTMFEAKTRLSELAERARQGEKIILITGLNRTPVAMIAPLEPAKHRTLDLFHGPDFDIPSISEGAMANFPQRSTLKAASSPT